MSELINGRTPEEIKAAVLCTEKGTIPDCVNCPYCGELDENGFRAYQCHQANFDLVAYAEHLESERDAALAKQPKWISVEERLPERYTPVLILVKRMPDNPNSSYICLVGVYDGGYWAKDSGYYYDDIDGEAVCWMPLPEPPEEDE